jgi:IMP cyclohydrolase
MCLRMVIVSMVVNKENRYVFENGDCEYACDKIWWIACTNYGVISNNVAAKRGGNKPWRNYAWWTHLEWHEMNWKENPYVLYNCITCVGALLWYNWDYRNVWL